MRISSLQNFLSLLRLGDHLLYEYLIANTDNFRNRHKHYFWLELIQL
jgi:hypothetical protein